MVATPEVLATANTNKKLTPWGDFVFNGARSSIVMVNGGLMAKSNVELFQQAIHRFVDCAHPVRRVAKLDDGP
jgi:hypothetical protein